MMLIVYVIGMFSPAAYHRPIGRLQKITSAPDTLYFTIDDGPSACSRQIDSIAKMQKARINVFLVGAHVLKYDDIPYFEDPFVKVANHSFSHADGHYRRYYRNAQNVLADFEKNALLIHGRNRIARLPGRNTWRINGRRATDLRDADAAADSLASVGFVVFGWDIEWRYADPTTRRIQPATELLAQLRQLKKNGKSYTRNHIVILCHEIMFSDTRSQSELVYFFQSVNQNSDFVFAWLKQYPGYR